MDVAALGPALIAMGELFTIANETLNGTQATVETKVKADFKEGSFEVFYSINQLLNDPNSPTLSALFVLGSSPLVGQVVGHVLDKAKDKLGEKAVEGLFALLAKLRGKRPEATKFDESRNVYIFNTGDNNQIIVEQPTGELYRNPRVRSAAARVAAPLARSGIKRMVARRNKEEVAVIEKSDMPELADLEVPPSAVLLPDFSSDIAPQRLIVKILRFSFPDGKLSVSDGNRKFDVLIEDADFVSKIHDRKIGFYEGDLYQVEIQTIQRVSGNKLKTERIITQVIAPIPVETQSEFEGMTDELPKKRPRKSLRS
jgi:hypothetical protein